MATKRWYLTNALDANGWQALSETAAGAATLSTGGWVVGTGLTNHSEFSAATTGDRASTTFTGTTVPDGTLDTTLDDAFRTPQLRGTFAAANWTFQFAVVSTVQSGAADGQIVFRLIKANADGSGATEITAAQQSASVMTNVAGTDINGTLTFNPGAITFNDQYLFIQVAWKRTGAGGMTTTNIRLRTGSSATVGTTILSSDFTPGVATLGATVLSTSVVTAPPSISFLKRVQATGKARIANTTTPLTFSFAALPAVGNAIVVEVWGSDAGPAGVQPMVFVDGWVTDNQGNNYDLAVTKQITGNTNFACAIYYCPRVNTSSGTFTLSITSSDSRLHWWIAAAVEVGDLSGGLLNFWAAQSASGSGTSVSTGNTSTLSAEYFVAAVMTNNLVSTATSITASSIGSPEWTQDVEELSGAAWMNGEGMSNIHRRVAEAADWTQNPTAGWAAAVAAFRREAPPADQAVTGSTIAVGSVANAPTVAYGVSGQTVSSTARIPYTETLLFESSSAGGSYSDLYQPGRNTSQTISGHSGILSSISLSLRKGGNPTDALSLVIRDTSFDGTILGTTLPIPASVLTTSYAWVNFPLPAMVTLSAGTTYWIESYLTRTASSGTDEWQWEVKAGNLYAGGEAQGSNGLPYSGGGLDHGFRLYTGTSHTVIIDRVITGVTIGSGLLINEPAVELITGFDQAISGATILPAVGAGVDDLLLEDASHVLLEDGSGVLLEPAPGLIYPPTVSVVLAITTAFIGTRFSDAFQWSDGVLPTVSGGLYATTPGFGNIVVANHLAESASTAEHDAYLTSYTGSTTAQWSAITIASHANYIGTSVFKNGSAPTYYLLELVSADTWKITRMVSGGFTYIASFTVADTAPGTVARLEVAINASGHPVLTVYRNGVLVGTYTDSDAAKIISGVPGFRMWNPGTTGQLSKFEAGDLTGAQTFPLTVAAGAVAVSGGTASSTTQLFAPVLTAVSSVAGSTIASGVTLNTPTVGQIITAFISRSPVAAVIGPYYSNYGQQIAESFVGNGSVLTGVRVQIGRSISTVGTCWVDVYVTTGTHGVDAIPTGSPIAVSVIKDIATDVPFGFGGTWVEFAFVGAQQMLLASGVTYCVTLGRAANGGNLATFIANAEAPYDGNLSVFFAPDWSVSSTSNETSVLFEVLAVAALLPVTVGQVITSGLASTAQVFAPPAISYTQVLLGAFIESDLTDYSWLTTHPTLEAYSYDDLTGTGNYGEAMGQEFTVGNAEVLTGLDFRVNKKGSPTDNIYVEIRAGGPDGTLLGTSTHVAASDIPATTAQPSVFFTVPFATPVVLTPGTLYAWVLRRDGAVDTANCVRVSEDYSWPPNPNDINENYPGSVDDEHGALFYRSSIPGWYDGLAFEYGFEYRLKYAIGVTAPTAVAVELLPTIGSTAVVYGPVPQKVLDLHGFTADPSVLFANQSGNGFSQSVSGLAGPVDRVGFQLLYITGAVPGGDVFVRLRSGSPFGTILGDSMSVSVSTLPVQADGTTPVAPTYLSFPAHPVLASGTTYVFQIVRTASSGGAGDNIGVRADSANPYAGGVAASAGGSPQTGYDLFIDVWLFGGVTLLAPVNEVYAQFIPVRSTAFRPASLFTFSQTPLAIPSATIVARHTVGRFSNQGLSTTTPQWGQSFLGDGRTLGELSFWLSKVFGPTGNARAHVYATTGTHGVDAVPTGSPLATSTTLLNVTTLTSSFVETTFQFTNGPLLAVGVTYMAVLEGPNQLAFDRDLDMGHIGNSASLSSGTWTSVGGAGGAASTDMRFTARANLPAPSVELQDKSITTAFIAPTTALFTPTITPTQFVGGAFIEPDLSDYSWLTRFPTEEPGASLRLYGVAGRDDRFYLGQEFLVGNAETLTAIDLRSTRVNDLTDNILVEIRSGGRNGTVIGTSSLVASNSVPQWPAPSGFVTLPFPTSVALIPGTLYAWVLKRDVGSDDDYVEIVECYNFEGSVGLVDSDHPALAFDDTGAEWWEDSNGFVFSFEYRLHYAVGVFAPTVTTAPDQAISGATIGGVSGLPSPTVYWPLNENTGFTSANAGSEVGSYNLTLDDAGSWVAGKYGASALHCDGSGRAANFNQIIGSPYTIALWFKDWDGSDDGLLIAETTAFYAFYIDSTSIYHSCGVSNYVSELHGLTGGSTWHHLAVTRVSDTITFYLDGAQLGSPSELPGGTGLQLSTIGSYDDGTFPFTGTLDDIRYYPVTLSGSEVAALAALNPDVTAGGAVVFAPPVVTVGGAALGTAFLSATSQPFAPVLTAVSSGATIVSGSGTFPPSTALTITTAHQPTTGSIFAPTVVLPAVATVTLTTISSGSLVRTPTITTGPVTVLGTTLAATSTLAVPTLSVGPVAVTMATLAATSLVFAPVALPSGAVGGPTTPSTLQVFAPTVTPQAVAVSGAHQPTTLVVTAPTVATLTFVTTAHRAPTQQVFAPTVVPQAVGVVGQTVASTLQVFAPTIAVGVTIVTGATIGTTVVLFAPTFVARLDGTFISSSATLFPPTLLVHQAVTGAVVPSGVLTFAPALAPQVIGTTRLTAVQLFAPAVTVGAATVGGSTLASAALTYPPTLLVGAVTVGAAHRLSTLILFAPSLLPVTQVETVHRASTLAVFAPSVAVGPVTVAESTIPSTVLLFAPSVATQAAAPAIPSTSLTFAPTLAGHVVTALWIVSTELFPPSAVPLGEMILTFLPSGSAVFPPQMVAYAPAPEIHDFTSNLVREATGVVDLCRVQEGTVILTRTEQIDATVDRTLEMTSRVLQDRTFAVDVER